MKLQAFRKLAPSATLLIFIAFVLSCNFDHSIDYDHGIDPVPYRIRGEVVFVNPPAPKFLVREVAFVAVKKLPPENFLTDVVFSDPLPIDTSSTRTEPDTIRFDIVADAGSYEAAGVLWRRVGGAWDIANILGLYTGSGQITPKRIDLTAEHPVEDSVSIIANWDLAKRDAIIEGDITFEDVWPPNTEIVAVAFYQNIPTLDLHYIGFLKGLDINIKKFVPTYHYRTAVSGGTYRFIAMFWFGKGSSLASIRAIGFHRCPTDSLRPKQVVVAPGETASDVDFNVRFSSLPAGVNFHKDGRDCSP